MFICENCIEKCEGPAVEITKQMGPRSRGACEDCGSVGFNQYKLPEGMKRHCKRQNKSTHLGTQGRLDHE